MRWMNRVHRWWNQRELVVFYDPAYRLPIASLEGLAGMEPRRADFVTWYLVDRGIVPSSQVLAPRVAAYDDLLRAHDATYLESLTDPERLARIFAVDPRELVVDEVLRTVRLAVGGTIEAAAHTLRTRIPAFNTLGGFHHAGVDYGTGFSALNDIGVAVARLRHDGFRGRVGVLDLDAHLPDGTRSTLAKDPDHWIGSLSADHAFDSTGIDETRLPTGTGDVAYLAALDALLARMPPCALVFVVAGGDVLAGDRLGGLGLTLDGARQRDLHVATALRGLPQVWLPAGGYNHESWRVFAGSALAVGLGTRRPIRVDYDPLKARFEAIAAGVTAATHDDEEDWSDVEAELGLSRSRRTLFLDLFSAQALEHRLHAFGILAQLERLGYGAFRIEVEMRDVGDRMRLFAQGGGVEHVLIEYVAERRVVAGLPVLYVHWFTLRHPLAAFDERRPKLPGQDVPGLGLAREAGEMMAVTARRLSLAGVAFTPAWFHVAYTARYRFRFVDPACQGRFEALLRDTRHLTLLEATLAVAEGRVWLDGAPYAWEADEMLALLPADDAKEPPPADPQVAEFREKSHFAVRPRGPLEEHAP